ncbi:MAG: glycosyltransferase [Mariprofundaceae bacterium]|nr:glycosyltransferase [Mariprofundaceae bacterium]
MKMPRSGRGGWPWNVNIKALPSLMPDGTSWPKITVVTPSYNQGEYIEETIRSILLQGYPNLEYIIMDGGSTDQTVEVIKKYAPWIDYWVTRKDRGQSHAINKGFQKASGDIIAWLNSDDYFLPNCLMNVALAYSLDVRGYWVGVGSGERVDAKGHYQMIHSPSLLSFDGLMDWDNNWFIQPACFFSRSIWHEYGNLDENLQFAMDFDLWLRFSKHCNFTLINHILCANRNHENTKTNSMRGDSFAEGCIVRFHHGGEKVAQQSIANYVNQSQRPWKLWNRLAEVPGRRFLQFLCQFLGRKLNIKTMKK